MYIIADVQHVHVHRGHGSTLAALLLASVVSAKQQRPAEADADKGLSFVALDEEAKAFVGAAARERAKYGEGIVIPLFSNRGFMSFLRNLICSMRRLRVNNWLVIAMDNETCPALMGKPGRGEQSACVYPYAEAGGVTSQQGVATYRSVAFNRMVMQRPLWVQFLLREGHGVVQCDLDIVWLRDPQPLFRTGVVVGRPNMSPSLIPQADAQAMKARQTDEQSAGRHRLIFYQREMDMALQSEQAYGLNGGFYYAKPTANTFAFFDDWLLHLQTMMNLPTFEEQHALNGAVNRIRKLPNRSFFYARFPEREFPNGKMWWSYPMEIDKRTTYVVHVNWVKQQKKTRMLRDSLWFLDPTDSRCDADFDPLGGGGAHPPCSKQCNPIGFAPLNGGNHSLKRCDQINNEDNHMLSRTVAHSFNKTGQWPPTMANTFWHPLAYERAPPECRRLAEQPQKSPVCTPCKRHFDRPLAAEAYEAAFGAAALERPAPTITYDSAKPW